MLWCDEGIEQAIKIAKTKKAIFVVFVKDPLRETPLDDVVESTEVSDLLQGDQFVAIRISSDTEHYRQFCDIYHFVPTPSLFFIGTNGWPIEIISGELPHNSILERINNIARLPRNIDLRESESASLLEDSSSSLSGTENTLTENILTENLLTESDSTTLIDSDLCFPEDTDNTTSCSFSFHTDSVEQRFAPDDASDNESSKEQDTVKELPKGSSDDEAHVDTKLPPTTTHHIITHQGTSYSHERSPTRVQTVSERPCHNRFESIGRPVYNAMQEDYPITGVLFSLGRWMRNRFVGGRGMTLGSQTAPVEGSSDVEQEQRMNEPLSHVPSSSESGIEEVACIQFRLPDGSTHSRMFSSITTMREVRDYVRNNMNLSFRDFCLSTSYPRVVFSEEHQNMTIAGLGLVPRSVILVIPSPEGNRQIITATEALWALITWPFSAVFAVMAYVSHWFHEPSANPDPNSSPTRPERTSAQNTSARNTSGIRRRLPTSSTIQRDGNVYRLSNQQEDSEDENNTWNGNSTQQM